MSDPLPFSTLPKIRIDSIGIKTSRQASYPDACGHGGFVASFRYREVVGHWEREDNQDYWEDKSLKWSKWHDLYVFDQRENQEVCIRCSEEGSDYISPGSLGQFIQRATNRETNWRRKPTHCEYGQEYTLPHFKDTYGVALEILRLNGYLGWFPTKP